MNKYSPYVVLGLIVFIYFFLRLFNLSSLPIFFDEANYIFWAKRIADSNQHWFLPLAYGKPVPFIWLITLFLKVLPNNFYLVAGRLPSVLFGILTLIGIYKLGTYVFNIKVGLVAAFLYELTPFALFYDRMALYDSMLSSVLIWAVFFMFQRQAVLWGLFLGFALLTKASALSYELLMPAAYLVANNFKKVRLIIIAFVVSQIVANVQIVSSGYSDYLKKSLDYTPGVQTINRTHDIFIPNLILSWQWLSAYLTQPILFLIIIGLGFLIWKKTRLGLAFFILGVIPVVGFSFLGKIYFPRYLLFTLPLFLIPTAYLLTYLATKFKFVMFVILPFILFLCVKFDFFLLTAPWRANFPEIDRWQYVSGYPSGYGLEPIFSFIHNESQDKKIHLIVQGSFSHYPNAFFLEFWDNKNVWIEERWPLEKSASQEFFPPNKTKPTNFDKTYFIVRNDKKSGLIDVVGKYKLTTLIESGKPGGEDSVFLAVSAK